MSRTSPKRLGSLGRRLLGPTAQRAAIAARRRTIRHGLDTTVRSTTSSALIIAPHPGGEVLACGATVARKRAAGVRVDIAVVADQPARSPSTPSQTSAAESPADLAQACAILGVASERLHLLGFQRDTVERAQPAVVAALSELIDEARPVEILVAGGQDQNRDHQAVVDATFAAIEASTFAGRVLSFVVSCDADGRQDGTPSGHDRHHAVAELVATGGFLGPKHRALNTVNRSSWTGPETDSSGGPPEVFFPMTSDAMAGRADLRVPSPVDPVTAVDERSHDDFTDTRLPGAVVGSRSADGSIRHGIDAEDRIGIDDGALRFSPLRTPGWGRQAIAYGPFGRRAGLAMSVLALNGHNAAQSDVLAEGRRAMTRRLIREFPSGRRHRPHIDDNLAIGFFDQSVPDDPTKDSNAFIMHSAGPINGELRLRADGHSMRVHQGIQNIPIQYIVVLRAIGATYYVSGTPGAAGLGDHPLMRPVGVDTAVRSDLLYAGVHQAVHGETRYLMDTRVDGIRVEQVPGLVAERWGALVADRLVAEPGIAPTGGPSASPLDGAMSETGGIWRAENLLRKANGAMVGPLGSTGLAQIDALAPAGLLHATLSTDPRFAANGGRVELRFRGADDGDGPGWRLVAAAHRLSLEIRAAAGGEWTVVVDGGLGLASATVHHVQILDTGRSISVHIDGELGFDGWVDDDRLAEATSTGFMIAGLSSLSDFEVLPRELAIPTPLLLNRPWVERGEDIVFHERFDGPARELDTPVDASNLRPLAPTWERVLGTGRVDIDGRGGGVVRGSPQAPNPGRTAFVTDWVDPTFADIELRITPPGTRRGEGHNGRGGVIFWENAANFVIVSTWLDDHTEPDGTAVHDGSAISQFWMTDGHEGFYEAVWANVARQIRWGVTSRIRVASDGRRFLTWLDDEPVLYRTRRDIVPRARPLLINRIGLVINREWGDDTGTRFEELIARRHRF